MVNLEVNKMRQLKLIRFILIGLLCQSTVARCDFVELNRQLTVRAGNVGLSFTGKGSIIAGVTTSLTGSIEVPNTIDISMEFLFHRNTAFRIRGVLAYDFNAVNVPYFFLGPGLRFYFGSTGVSIDSHDNGTRVKIVPKWRFYSGLDVGVSQVIAGIVGVGATVSNLAQMTANIGFIYSITPSVGLELEVGAGAGLGISYVAVNGLMHYEILGLSYLF
jgi:hypothetical protein